MKKLLLLLLFGGVCLHFCYSQSQSLPIEKLIEIFNNPANYPNYIRYLHIEDIGKIILKILFQLYKLPIDLGAGYGGI